MRVSGRDNTKPWLHITEKVSKPSPTVVEKTEESPTIVERIVEVVREPAEAIISQAVATYSKVPMGHRWERTNVVKLPSRTLPAGLIVNAEDPTGTFSYMKVYGKEVKSEDVFPHELVPGNTNAPRIITLTATWRE